MTEHSRTNEFAQALNAFEKGDPDALLSMFADDATLERPEQTGSGSGTDAGAKNFWETYQAQFTTVSSEFTRVAEAGDEGVLEWRSNATLTTGRDITYAGVSLLTFESDRIARFATYYDTAAFITATP